MEGQFGVGVTERASPQALDLGFTSILGKWVNLKYIGMQENR